MTSICIRVYAYMHDRQSKIIFSDVDTLLLHCDEQQQQQHTLQSIICQPQVHVPQQQSPYVRERFPAPPILSQQSAVQL